MDTKANEVKTPSNITLWHSESNYRDNIYYYIESLKADNYQLKATIEILIERLKRLEAENITANERIKILTAELKVANELITSLTGKVRELTAEKFTASSEKTCYRKNDAGENHEDSESQAETKPEEVIDIKEKRKKRGGCIGHKGYGRKVPQDLPIKEVVIEIPENEKSCKTCGKEYQRTTITEESSKIDIEITVKRIVYQRITYKKACNCESSPQFLVAPKPEGIIPKSLFTNSFWSMLLINKYFFQIPLNRQIKMIGAYNYKLNPSTIIGGFEKILGLLIPLYEKLKEESLKDTHWWCDETRWLVFEEKVDKETYLWWLWTFVTERITIFVLDSSRSSSVCERFFGKNAQGTVNVDRWGAYNVLKIQMLLAYCWYHLRRDFIKAGVSFPELTAWVEEWLKEISKTEKLNNARLKFEKNSLEFKEAQGNLERQINNIKEKLDGQLSQDNLTKKQKTIFTSMSGKWGGYTVFVNDPKIPMHNNVAENALRSGAVGRNNYYGSHAEWSGNLAAVTMSIFKTAEKNGIMPQKYLEYYFEICQTNGGKPPEDLEMMLPWNVKQHLLKSDDLELKSG
jgi:transposase